MSVTVVLGLFDWLLVPTSTPTTVDDKYFAEWYTILRYASGDAHVIGEQAFGIFGQVPLVCRRTWLTQEARGCLGPWALA